MFTKKNIAVFVVLALATMCFAPIEDKPKGAQFHGELTDAQLEAAQRGDVTAPTPSGGSSLKEDQKADIGLAPSDDGASRVVASAEADRVLKKADDDVKSQEGAKARPLWIGGGVLLAVAAVLMAGKVWLDKAVPASNN
ncbi:MAG: hypothetical protein JSS65_04175 [Armatimonadetes bacterium]|nr:hypothetical protein [Armatimonadota bacterium]